MWRCTIEGHTDVVVRNPREAREWMQSQTPPINGPWRTNFDRDTAPVTPEEAPPAP